MSVAVRLLSEEGMGPSLEGVENPMLSGRVDVCTTVRPLQGPTFSQHKNLNQKFF